MQAWMGGSRRRKRKIKGEKMAKQKVFFEKIRQKVLDRRKTGPTSLHGQKSKQNQNLQEILNRGMLPEREKKRARKIPPKPRRADKRSTRSDSSSVISMFFGLDSDIPSEPRFSPSCDPSPSPEVEELRSVRQPSPPPQKPWTGQYL